MYEKVPFVKYILGSCVMLNVHFSLLCEFLPDIHSEARNSHAQKAFCIMLTWFGYGSMLGANSIHIFVDTEILIGHRLNPVCTNVIKSIPT